MPTPDWAPSVEQVAAYVPARTTVLDDTAEAGTFTDETRPTATAVALLADQAASKVLVAIGGVLPERLQEAAQGVAALLAAAQIELRYFPDQLDSDRSPYDALSAQFDKELGWLISSLQETGTEESTVTAGMPAYGFPRHWRTREWCPMVTMRLTATDRAALRRMERLDDRASLKPVAPAMFREYKKIESLAFGTKGLSTADGAWPRLAASTIARKRARGYSLDTLVATGRLKRSLTSKSRSDTVYNISDDEIEFGSRVPYAKYHHSLQSRKMRDGKPILPRRRPISFTKAQKKQFSAIFRRYVLTGNRG